MTTFCSYTGGESCTPLIYCFVYDVCPMLCHTLNRCWHSSLTSFTFSRRPAVALQPRSYNPRGSYLGCFGGHWSGEMKSGVTASLGVKVRLCHAPCVHVRCPVGIWNCATWSESERRLLSCNTVEGEAVAMHQGNIGWQLHIPTRQWTVHLHTGRDRSVACVTRHRHFKFHKVVRQQI